MVVQEVGVLAWQGFVGMPGGALVGVPKVKGQEKDLEVGLPGGKRWGKGPRGPGIPGGLGNGGVLEVGWEEGR